MKISLAPMLVAIGVLALYGIAVPAIAFIVLLAIQAASWSLGSAALGWALVIAGFVVLVAAAPWLVAGFARVQEQLARVVFGLEAPVHPLRVRRVDGEVSWSSTALAQFADRRNLWGFAHALATALLGTVLVLIFVAVAMAVGLLCAALATERVRLAGFSGVTLDRVTAVSLCIAILVAGIALVFGTFVVFAQLTRLMLVPSKEAELAELAAVEQQRRSHAVEAADIERGRLERDLHDGVQPQLVSIAMTLGLAQRKLASDPSASSELLDEALTATHAAIGELRALVRGMRPAILSDKGLDAALSSLVSSSAIPVRLENSIHGRLAPQAELVLYFAIAESITNAVKHSGASQIEVSVGRSEGRTRARISDDGRGGAVRAVGGGIAGVAERVAAAGGAYSLSSPEGGPTVIEVMVPCES